MKIFYKTIILLLFSVSIFSQNKNYGCQNGKQLNFFPPIYNSPENLRSDTFDILKYTINLEIGNTLFKQIAGNTQIRFTPKINNQNFIRLDLLKLTIDSVKENASLLNYIYNDTILRVNFAVQKNVLDTSTLIVYYHGQPQGDPSGWGGFYFDNTGGAQYAYNLGVGFGAKPHNYGRVWFPCFDNFVERSKYEFNIVSDSTRRAYCNGELISDVVTINKRSRKWVLNNEIPTYLASVALANYKQVNWSVNTLSGVKPITLVGVKADTLSMKNGFVNLKNCINGFENYFGPYKWNRFGYSLVPFNSGAMEHATNIAYPRAFIGNLAYEADLMAHELSHHWWGDLVTCETQEDMWINEGMATFSSYMFLEWKYGKKTYLNSVKNEHDKLLQFLHKKESGFRAISGVPHSLTYGDHVYKKGADVAHTLRGYMGDAAFFNGLKFVLQQQAFKSLNSIEFRNLLQANSGQNLTDFFNDWVLSGGWPHFSLDSVKYNQISLNSYDAAISLKQKSHGAPALYNNVPLEISFFKNDFTVITRTVNMVGGIGNFTLNIPFMPVYCAINFDSKISDATSHEVKTLKTVTNVNWTLGKVFMMIKNKGSDSSLVRVIHNYVAPDAFKNNPSNYKLSNQHYWKIEGILSPGFVSRARFTFDGNKATSGTSYMDTLLTIVNCDSVRLFYRVNAADDWKLVKNQSIFISGTRKGDIEIDTLKIGEYTFGNTTDTSSVGLEKFSKSGLSVNVFPNPAKNKINIQFNEGITKEYILDIYDSLGKKLASNKISNKLNQFDVSFLNKGIYFLKIETDHKLFFAQKLIIE